MFLLISSLISALLIIALVMGIIFRSIAIGWVGFAANAIPIIWFVLFMLLFKFDLTIEALIAMTISVGLTSDTIIHFGYKYFRSRYFGRTRKHALEIMFFYAAVPAIISAAVLMIVFSLLNVNPAPISAAYRCLWSRFDVHFATKRSFYFARFTVVSG